MKAKTIEIVVTCLVLGFALGIIMGQCADRQQDRLQAERIEMLKYKEATK